MRCECSDPQCPAHVGFANCPHTYGAAVLYRVDMVDNTGTAFCEECGEDAMDSGLFTAFLDEDMDEDF